MKADLQKLNFQTTPNSPSAKRKSEVPDNVTSMRKKKLEKLKERAAALKK